VEHVHLVILDVVRTVPSGSELDHAYQGEAAGYASYIHNNTPKCAKLTTPDDL
jgi:hypothetical protein